MSSIKRFKTSGFSSLWLRISVSTLFMNIIRKGDCHFRAHGCTMCLKVVFFHKTGMSFLEELALALVLVVV